MSETKAEYRARMVRPGWYEFVKKTSGGYLQCTCGRVLQTFEQVRDHWQLGHFDYPTEYDKKPETILEELQRVSAALSDVIKRIEESGIKIN